MRTIIAGSRHITDASQVWEAVIKSGFQITTVISGNAKGVDRIGANLAKIHNIPVEYFDADWKTHGKAAGPIRNAKMADNAEALIAVWDGESRGTRHMIKDAEKKGLKVFVYHVKED